VFNEKYAHQVMHDRQEVRLKWVRLRTWKDWKNHFIKFLSDYLFLVLTTDTY